MFILLKPDRVIPNVEKVRKVVAQLLVTKVLTVKQIAANDSTTFECATSTGSYILRTGGKRANYDVEHEVLLLVREEGVKAPRLIAANIDTKAFPFTFSLLEKIRGDNLNYISKKEWPSILSSVGSQLRKVYALKFSGFGSIDTTYFRKTGELKGRFRTWHGWLVDYMSFHAGEIKEKIEKDKTENFTNSKLSAKQRKQVLEIVNRLDEVERRLREANELDSQGYLVHGDLHFDHILVSGGKLAGLIDFNKTLIADPLFDIAYFSVMPHGNYYEILLESSKVPFNRKRFHLYRLLISVAKIHTRYIEHDYLHEYPEILEYALEELNS